MTNKYIFMLNENSEMGYGRRDYGRVGEETDVRGVCVGDLIRVDYGGSIKYLIVTKDARENKFYPMGLWLADINELSIEVALSHKFVTNEMLAEHGLRIKEMKKTRLSLREIEELLGYPIEIV